MYGRRTPMSAAGFASPAENPARARRPTDVWAPAKFCLTNRAADFRACGGRGNGRIRVSLGSASTLIGLEWQQCSAIWRIIWRIISHWQIRLCWPMRQLAKPTLCARRGPDPSSASGAYGQEWDLGGRMVRHDAPRRSRETRERRVYHPEGTSGQAKGRGNVLSVNADRCNPLPPASTKKGAAAINALMKRKCALFPFQVRRATDNQMRPLCSVLVFGCQISLTASAGSVSLLSKRKRDIVHLRSERP